MKSRNICAALLAMTMAACTNNEEITTPEEGITSIIAEIIQPSRVVIGAYDKATKTYPLEWSGAKSEYDYEADKINIFDKDGNMSTLFYEGTKPSTVGKFTFIENASGEKITNIDYAIANVFMDGNNFGINETDAWTALHPDAAVDVPMYGVMDETTKNLKFYQVMGLIELNVNGALKAEDKIVISCDENNALGGTATIVADKTAPKDAKLVISKETSRNSVSCDVLFDTKTKTGKLYLPIPVGEYDYLKVSLTREVFAGDVKQNWSSDVIIRRAGGAKLNIEKKLYPFSVTFGELKGPDPAKGENAGWDREDNWGDGSSDIIIE